MNIKKLLLTALAVLVFGGIISYLFYQQNQPLKKDNLKKEMLTVESTLLEASLLTRLSYEQKTTSPFLKIHTQELSKQLQQSEQLLHSVHPTSDIQKQTKSELQLISTTNQLLQNLSNNPQNPGLIKATHTKLIFAFKEQQELEKSL